MPKQTPIYIWETIEQFYETNTDYAEKNNLTLDSDKKEVFIQTFLNMYEKIKNHYMKDGVNRLDHHKQAAIIIYSLISNSVVYSTEQKNMYYGTNPKEIKYPTERQEISVELEKIALLIGLNFMSTVLNEYLSAIGEQNIQKYDMPTPLSCNNEYFVVLLRQLFFDFHYGTINNPEVYILSLANVLYLIEYLTLVNNGINIEKLKEHIDSINHNN